MFIFDIFPLSERMATLEVPRSENFAPVKNADASDCGREGPVTKDSPASAAAMLSTMHRSWLEAAGAKLTGATAAEAEAGLPTSWVLVDPLVSYGGEGLDSLKGVELETPCVLRKGKEGAEKVESKDCKGPGGETWKEYAVPSAGAKAAAAEN